MFSPCFPSWNVGLVHEFLKIFLVPWESLCGENTLKFIDNALEIWCSISETFPVNIWTVKKLNAIRIQSSIFPLNFHYNFSNWLLLLVCPCLDILVLFCCSTNPVSLAEPLTVHPISSLSSYHEMTNTPPNILAPSPHCDKHYLNLPGQRMLLIKLTAGQCLLCGKHLDKDLLIIVPRRLQFLQNWPTLCFHYSDLLV